MIKNLYFLLGFIFLAFIPIWLLFIVPNFLEIPSDFYYEADIFSIDNFYDPVIGDFSTPINSETTFLYDVTEEKDNVLLIRNIFSVFEPTNRKIFSVDRIYGIDRKTGQHVAGYGDKDRIGYLFAPKNLKKGQSYIYWHINYDTPIEMKFKEEVDLFGLKVYRYEKDFYADQTVDLGDLPGVPEERGVNLKVNLQTWIEPVTGRLIRYEDNVVAYYYNIETGENIYPWNKFNNFYRDSSVLNQINMAEKEKIKLKFYKIVIPFIFVIFSSILFFINWRQNENKK